MRPTSIYARILAAVELMLLMACGDPTSSFPGPEAGQKGEDTPSAESALESARLRMVADQMESRGITDRRVLAAMRKVPRHEFVPTRRQPSAYEDRPLPIGHGQTISQPYVVAAMTELAALSEGDRVLEIGTGSGYQAAVLAELAAQVYTIEIVEALAERSGRTLKSLGYASVQVRHGDGYRGWPEAAPFDAIVVTAAAPRVPPDLLEQLALGGRLVIPVGDAYQELEVHTRTPSGVEVRRVFPVRFVPMTGEVRELQP
jgi:protein-L-isoaspartate(D-aspartate) O-methyltransferase